MYSRVQVVKKYLHYFVKASNGKGHGIHSPFVFDFIIHVLNDNTKYEAYKIIEQRRKNLLKDNREIEVEDFGAGSKLVPFKRRSVKNIASHSLKSRKYAQLLFRIAQYYKAKTIVEMGTSLGITSMYLASTKNLPEVYTLEGASAIAAIAANEFREARLGNIHLRTGSFDKTLPGLLAEIESTDLLFIDGNHRKDATLEYFETFLAKKQVESIFIMDDIHWSAGMEEAWNIIKEHPAVTLTIDLFFIGLVFFDTQFTVKQHFTLRF